MVKLKRMGHVEQMWEKRNINILLGEKMERKRPLGRPRYRWVDNIKHNILVHSLRLK
jgi:hypothetical protein